MNIARVARGRGAWHDSQPTRIKSASLAISQLTFILRIAIQILSYDAGLTFDLLGFTILGTVPRTANIEAHNVINHRYTCSTAMWIVGYFS
jgi:hypothetical protein